MWWIRPTAELSLTLQERSQLNCKGCWRGHKSTETQERAKWQLLSVLWRSGRSGFISAFLARSLFKPSFNLSQELGSASDLNHHKPFPCAIVLMPLISVISKHSSAAIKPFLSNLPQSIKYPLLFTHIDFLHPILFMPTVS